MWQLVELDLPRTVFGEYWWIISICMWARRWPKISGSVGYRNPVREIWRFFLCFDQFRLRILLFWTKLYNEAWLIYNWPNSLVADLSLICSIPSTWLLNQYFTWSSLFATCWLCGYFNILMDRTNLLQNIYSGTHSEVRGLTLCWFIFTWSHHAAGDSIHAVSIPPPSSLAFFLEMLIPANLIWFRQSEKMQGKEPRRLESNLQM